MIAVIFELVSSLAPDTHLADEVLLVFVLGISICTSDSLEEAPADDGVDLGFVTGVLMGVGELTNSVLGV